MLTNTELQMLNEALFTKCEVIFRKILMMNEANEKKEQTEETKKEEE